MNDILFCHKPTDTPAFLTDEPLELPQRRHPRPREREIALTLART
ncbi:hypothetical protein [Phormidium sp. CCY1219]|nr:hypothetical protein [Phormidium sp. CCY1219]